MPNKRIAFQGEPGAYSEEALLLIHPDAEAQPYREFRDVAQAVLARRVELGVLPIENSVVGSIATNFDLIADSGLAIVGEVVSAVHHCLLGIPGAQRGSLRRVLSHPVAPERRRGRSPHSPMRGSTSPSWRAAPTAPRRGSISSISTWRRGPKTRRCAPHWRRWRRRAR